MTMVGLCGSVSTGTERASGMVLIPPNFTLILHMNELRFFPEMRSDPNLLEADVGEVLGLRAAALHALEALGGHALRDVAEAIVHHGQLHFADAR